MNFTRRETMAVSGAALVASVLPIKLMASTTDLISGITGGTEASGDGINLTAPEIAENGNTVPISVEGKKATAIKILALGNPGPDVVTFKFRPLSATHTASTRIRLRKTQEVMALAKLEDGSFIQDIKTVKVTIGGCGG